MQLTLQLNDGDSSIVMLGALFGTRYGLLVGFSGSLHVVVVCGGVPAACVWLWGLGEGVTPIAHLLKIFPSVPAVVAEM